MNKQTRQWTRFLGTAALAMTIVVPGMAAPQNGRSRPTAEGRYATTNAVNGVVQEVNRSLNYITVRDQATGRDLKIDVRDMNTRQSINVWGLRPGDLISADGSWEKNNTFRADKIGFSTNQLATSVAAANRLSGTVQSTNRKLNYVTVHDQATGRNVKVDVRNMDTRQSVNVWQLRSGDAIVVNGGWTNRNTFQANRINSEVRQQPMTSGYGTPANFVTGTVQNVNRDLGYMTVLNETTGQSMKIDLRKMDTRRSVDVWHLRSGDRISVNGTWANRETFQADIVNF